MKKKLWEILNGLKKWDKKILKRSKNFWNGLKKYCNLENMLKRSKFFLEKSKILSKFRRLLKRSKNF